MSIAVRRRKSSVPKHATTVGKGNAIVDSKKSNAESTGVGFSAAVFAAMFHLFGGYDRGAIDYIDIKAFVLTTYPTVVYHS